MNERNIQRPTALVVGACGGMGFALARRLGQSYRVILADINTDQLSQDTETLTREGIEAQAVECDVTSDVSVNAVAQKILSAGPLHALVHVVGLSPVAKNPELIARVNLQGATRVANAIAPTLQRGVGVFISSMAGHRADVPPEILSVLDNPLCEDFWPRLNAAYADAITPAQAYAVSKFALNRMVINSASAWGLAGNRIVSVSPGLIATPMGISEFKNSPMKNELLAKTPLQRQGSLQEIADVIEFLVSPKASFITGTDILVDGGIVATLRSQKTT